MVLLDTDLMTLYVQLFSTICILFSRVSWLTIRRCFNGEEDSDDRRGERRIL